jgi:hypothetical protein
MARVRPQKVSQRGVQAGVKPCMLLASPAGGYRPQKGFPVVPEAFAVHKDSMSSDAPDPVLDSYQSGFFAVSARLFCAAVARRLLQSPPPRLPVSRQRKLISANRYSRRSGR